MEQNRPMPKRQAQVLAAIVWLANRSGGQVPKTRPLFSLIGNRPRDAREWLEFFSELGGYFIADGAGPEYINRRQLTTDPDEAACILTVDRLSNKRGRTTGFAPLLDLLIAVRPELRCGNPPPIEGILLACQAKGYLFVQDRRYILTAKALKQLPYLRILARNFRPTRLRITKRTAA